MPHQVSPQRAHVMISKPSLTPGVPLTQEEVSLQLDAIFKAQTSQKSLDAAYSLTNLILNLGDIREMRKLGILEEIKRAAANKKDGSLRESAMLLLGALFEKLPRAQPVSEIVFLVQEGGMLAPALDALADKGGVVRESAQYALDALFMNLTPEAMTVGLLPALSRYLSHRSGKWQGTVGAYDLIGKMADKAKVGTGTKEEEKTKDLLRESMGIKLASLIPIVEGGMHDLKAEVWARSKRW